MNKFFGLLFALIFTVLSISAQTTEDLIQRNSIIDTNKVVTPWELHPQILKTVSTLLQRYHFKKVHLDDSLSSIIFDEYIKRFDINKLYFTQKDIKNFEQYRFEFDDDIRSGNVYPAFKIFNQFKKNLTSSMPIIEKILNKGFDFTKEESFEPNRKDADWPKDSKEVENLWKLRLKNEALNLKLNGKECNEIKETLLKRYHRFHKIILQYDAEDVFQLFMNSYAYNQDPHTTYFSPKSSDDFKIGMSLSLEGIGATLTNRDDYTTIVRIVPGGPASQSGLLFADDKIVAVAQDDDGEWVDVVGWRVDDVVLLIRGKKGTKVRLQILHDEAGINEKPVEVEIIRDKIKLTEQAAKADTVDLQMNGENFKLGVIDVPEFYTNFGKEDDKSSSTSEDVRRLLNDLTKAGADGIVIDLRNNGGGSLLEAIDMTGLFIKEGPVVQVKNVTGKIDIEEDPDPNIVYDKPIVVMVNRYSASASEIFSGAIQDYGRGVIVGEQTYGKGTVQNMIGLDRIIRETPEQKIGSLKMTIAKFYRVTGSSTQHKGVEPDISFPSVYDPHESGESSNKSALKWDLIKSSEFNKYSDLSHVIQTLEKNYKERIKTNPEFKYIKEDIEDFKENKDKKTFSLNEKIRKDEREKRDKIKETRKEEREKLAKDEDPLLSEAEKILADLVLQTKKRGE